jgi:hypothetical protein
MKKLLLSLLACGAVAAANAQAGSILVFGDAGISATKEAAEKPDKELKFNITPGVGYQFNKNWTVGIYGNYSSETVHPDGGKRSGDKAFGGGVFGRFTHNISPIFSLFGQARVGYVAGHSILLEEKVEASQFNGFEAGFFPAVGINVINGFALNFSFGGVDFRSTKLKDADYSTSSFGLTFGQQFHAGISKNFGCGHKAKKGKHGMMDDTRRVDARDEDEDDAPRKKRKAARDDDDE